MPGTWKHDWARLGTAAWTPVRHLLVLFGLSLVSYQIYVSGSVVFPGRPRGSALATTESFEHQCLKFRPNIPAATFERVEYLIAGNQADLKYRDATCGGPGTSNAVTDEVCRIALYIPTSSRSGIHFEVWLPKSWNSRFLSTGNGGIGGCLDYAGLVYTTGHGFAAVATNNGHNGTTGNAFYQNPDVIHDFADRALHTGVTVGKNIVKQFYGHKHDKSYFLGCSQGGRQGIANAMKFPHDFDGIVAGAPALDFNSLVSWRASFYPLTGLAESDDFIKPDVWSGLVHKEVLRQCDHLDGVLDGIIEYPNLCDFHPDILLCRPGDDPDRDCLSQVQVDVVKKVFKPFTYSDGSVIYPGMQVGSEQRAIDRLYAGKAFADSRDWFRYVVYSDPSWDATTFTTEDAREAQKLNPFDIRTYPAPHDLKQFRGRGGRILTYHGMQDQQITGHITRQWMDHMREYSSDQELEEWIRYFRVSGMLHCSGGVGAWMIGQTAGSVAYEPEKNVLAAIVDWVESGHEPDVLEGTKLADDSSEQGTVLFTRKHCRYPKHNRYIGQKLQNGQLPSYSSADQWICE